MLSTLCLGLLLVTTTHTSELVFGLAWLKVPRVLANMVTVAVRFLPGFLEEGRRILIAQQIRGAGSRGIRARARSFQLMAIPLVIGALKTARQLSLAAEVRGFQGDFHVSRTWKFSPVDRWGLALLVLFFVVFLGIRFSGENSGLSAKWGVPWH
jgi:energy-coupling factor transport system permease protein